MTPEQRTSAIEASGAKPRSEKMPNIVGISPIWAEVEGLMAVDEEAFLATIATWTALNTGLLKKAKDEEAAREGVSVGHIKAFHRELSKNVHDLEHLLDDLFLSATHKHAIERALLQLGETRDMIAGLLEKEA